MSSYSSFSLTEANPTTFFASTSIPHPAMPHCPAYFNSEVISTPVSLRAQSSFPPFHESIPLSNFDFTPPLLTTTMDVSNASVSMPLLSMETAASSGSSSHLPSIHPLYVTQPSYMSSPTSSHFVPYFPDLVVSPHNTHTGSPHQFAKMSYSQCNSEAWGAVSSSSINQHPQQKADPVVAHSYDPHLTPSYPPHLYDSAYYWNASQPECHSYMPPFHMSNLAAAQDHSPHMSSDQVPTQSVNYGKDFRAEEWSNDNGQVERSIGRDGKTANMHFGLDDRDCQYHQQGHVTEDPAWWWTYSAVADSKAVTDLQCNPVLCCNGKGYTHSSSLEETHLAKTQHPFSLKQAASVLADMLAKPVSKATGAPDFVISKSNVCATEGQTIYSGSSLKDSHDITQQNEDPALGDTLNFSTGQSFPVHLASSEQYSQPEDLLAITSSCPSKCDFGILSDMMKAKLRSDSMKQEVSKTSSLFKTREMSGSPPGLMEDRPVMAGLHDNLPLLDMDREVGIGNEKHAVVHQRISNSGMLNVQRESAALSAFPCHKVDAVSENEIATSAARNFIADDKACTNADYGMPEEDSELRSTRLNNVQIEQGVSHIEDCFNKNQSVCESKNLEHGPFELRPFAGHVDPSNDSCKVKLSVFNCHNETVQGPQGSIPSSMSTKESHSDGTKTARCDLMNKNGFAPYRGSDVCTENPLPYSKQCHSPDHKAQYLTAESAEFSSFRLVNDSILNLSEVLLAHGRPNTCNAADSSDLRNLQLSIKNLSQYLLFEKGNFASQNCVSSSKLHGKQGSVQDESSSDGTNKVSHNQGKGEAINHSCENLYDYPFIETCLEPKVPKQRNPCDNWGNARRCHLGDPSHREIYDSEKTHKLMDAGLAMKGGGNGAAERKLEEISFHDLGAVYQKLGADSEAQLQRMKVLLDSVRRYTGKGDVAESNIVDISHSAHQQKLMETEFASKDEKVKANNRLGCLCETFPWDDLQNFDLGLRAEFEKLQALVGNFNRQLSHEQWKGTVNPRELNWLMKDHMRRTTKETQKADGMTSTEVRNMNEAELEEEFGIAGKQANAMSEINLLFEPANKLHELCQLDDIARKVNALNQHRLVDFEEETLRSSDQDENIAVHSKHDESNTYPPDRSISISRFDDRKLPFEEGHVSDINLDIKGAGRSPPRIFLNPKQEKEVTEIPVYPDTKQVALRMALLKARPGWYEVCGDSGSIVNTEDESIHTEPSSHTLHEPRTLMIKENYYLGDTQESSFDADPIAELSGTSKQEYYVVQGIVHGGEKEEMVHKLNYGLHSACERGEKASFSYCRQNFDGQVDKEEIIFKPEHSLESPSELEDAGWEKVHVDSLDKKS